MAGDAHLAPVCKQSRLAKQTESILQSTYKQRKRKAEYLGGGGGGGVNECMVGEPRKT